MSSSVAITTQAAYRLTIDRNRLGKYFAGYTNVCYQYNTPKFLAIKTRTIYIWARKNLTNTIQRESQNMEHKWFMNFTMNAKQ